jgi:hypothetical protein
MKNKISIPITTMSIGMFPCFSFYFQAIIDGPKIRVKTRAALPAALFKTSAW